MYRKKCRTLFEWPLCGIKSHIHWDHNATQALSHLDETYIMKSTCCKYHEVFCFAIITDFDLLRYYGGERQCKNLMYIKA